jgi:hypothetical protein
VFGSDPPLREFACQSVGVQLPLNRIFSTGWSADLRVVPPRRLFDRSGGSDREWAASVPGRGRSAFGRGRCLSREVCVFVGPVPAGYQRDMRLSDRDTTLARSSPPGTPTGTGGTFATGTSIIGTWTSRKPTTRPSRRNGAAEPARPASCRDCTASGKLCTICSSANSGALGAAARSRSPGLTMASGANVPSICSGGVAVEPFRFRVPEQDDAIQIEGNHRGRNGGERPSAEIIRKSESSHGSRSDRQFAPSSRG